jgi:hypothetical protein
MEIAAASLSEKATLGQGYDTSKECFVGQCVQGEVEYAGNQESRISFERSLDQSTMQRELGFEVGARVRYGLFEGSAAAAFASSSSASEYSDVTVYSHTITFKNAKLKYPGQPTGLTPQGQAAKGAADGPYVGDNWCITCGHEFVDQITLGAKLLVSVTVEFSTREDKQAFSANFSFDGPPVSVNASLHEASKRFGKRASVSLQAYQLGGDVRKLSSIFGVDEGRAPILTASLDNPDAILATLDAAVRYSSAEFPTQIDPGAALGAPIGPAQLSYITSPWPELGLYSPPGLVEAGVVTARRTLSAAFERNATYQTRLSRILYGPVRLSPRQLAHFQAMQQAVAANLAKIQSAAVVAYTDFIAAADKVAATVAELSDFTAEDFEVVPESFAQWWDVRDLPGTLIRDKQVVDEIAGMYIPEFNDFAHIDDQGLALQRRLETVDYLALGQVNAAWLESPVFKLLVDAPIRKVSVQQAIPTLEPLRLLEHTEEASFMQDAPVYDLAPFSGLTKMRKLEMWRAPVHTLEPLAHLAGLQEFEIHNNERALADVTRLASLVQLKVVTLANGAIEDASALAALPALEQLGLGAGRLRTIAAFAALPALTSIDFGSRDAAVEDATSFGAHPRLANLFAAAPRIRVSEAKGWDATWTRRGTSNVFDVESRNANTGANAAGAAVVMGISAGRDVIFTTAMFQRDGRDVAYWGTVDGQNLKGNVMIGTWSAGQGLTVGEDSDGGEFTASVA